MSFALTLPRPGYALRPLRLTDQADLVRQADDADLVYGVGDNFPHPYTEDDAAQFLLSNVGRTDSTQLCLTQNDRLIGMVGIVSTCGFSPSSVFAEIGYWTGRSARGQGVTTLAISAYASHLFEKYPSLNRLEALTFPDNAASQRVLEKAGFVREAVLRGRARQRGRIVDDFLYARWRP